jgi:hypothetical protein
MDLLVLKILRNVKSLIFVFYKFLSLELMQ